MNNIFNLIISNISTSRFSHNSYTRRFFASILFLLILLSLVPPMNIQASARDYRQEAEDRKSLVVETNQIEGWPIGPAIGAESAILMEANTGTILYAKNIHKSLYPASVTKLLSTLIGVEQCSLDEKVAFSYDAVHSINWLEDANMGILENSEISVEQTIYGILVGSANEAAYALAEHISGNLEDFSILMNNKANDLGCTDSHFVTPNGIHDPEHYTSAYDLALIAKAFYNNEFLTKASSIGSYTIPQSNTQTKGELTVHSKNQLFPNKPYTYEYLVGSKTGYTSEARQTLVSCASHNGLKLICVIMREESPNQYKDTIELFNYGFDNFKTLYCGIEDTKYIIGNGDFFNTGSDIYGSSKPIISLDENDYIVLPMHSTLDDTLSTIEYNSSDDDNIARILYSYQGVSVGGVDLLVASNDSLEFDFSNASADLSKDYASVSIEDSNSTITINVTSVITIIAVTSILIVLLIILIPRIIKRIKWHKRYRSLRRGRYGTKSYFDKDLYL